VKYRVAFIADSVHVQLGPVTGTEYHVVLDPKQAADLGLKLLRAAEGLDDLLDDLLKPS